MENEIYDHGVLGTVNIISKLGKKAADNKTIKEALTAISLHNQTEIKINFKDNPIAFLLVLCDSLQEWGRTIIVENEPKTELDNIVLNLHNRKENDRDIYSFPETLKVGFYFHNTEVLKKTQWDYNIFINSITQNLGRLNLDGYNPKTIKVEVSIITETKIGEK